MEKKMKAFLMITLMLMMAGTAYAKGQDASGNVVVNGITGLVKLPITMLNKASDSLDSAPKSGSGSSEDVMVSDIYNLDAETTG